MTFAVVEQAAAAGWKPRVIVLDEANRIVKQQGI
jgi:aspartate 1-decarboxylase